MFSRIRVRHYMQTEFKLEGHELASDYGILNAMGHFLTEKICLLLDC